MNGSSSWKHIADGGVCCDEKSSVLYPNRETGSEQFVVKLRMKTSLNRHIIVVSKEFCVYGTTVVRPRIWLTMIPVCDALVISFLLEVGLSFPITNSHILV